MAPLKYAMMLLRHPEPVRLLRWLGRAAGIAFDGVRLVSCSFPD
ncbi:MAG: hypothetical protein ACJAVR_003845 [Paracoccaceae bacterium]